MAGLRFAAASSAAAIHHDVRRTNGCRASPRGRAVAFASSVHHAGRI